MNEQAQFPPAPVQTQMQAPTQQAGFSRPQPSPVQPVAAPQQAVPGSLVNQQTGEVIPLPSAFMRPQLDGIKLLNQPRDYRALCDKAHGFFSCNEISKGNAIHMRILNWKFEDGVRLSDVYPEPETVVQVLFIDEQNLVSTVLLRTSSMRNFMQFLDNATAEGHAVASLVVTAYLEKVTTKAAHTFHIVKFRYELNNDENIRQILSFIQSVPESLTCFRELPKEVVNVGGYAEGVPA